MPARRLRRARLLHEELVVEEVEAFGAQEPSRRLPERPLAAEGPEALILLPDALVAVEAAHFRLVADGIRSRLRNIAFDRVPQNTEPRSRHDALHQHRAVAVEFRPFARCRPHGILLSGPDTWPEPHRSQATPFVVTAPGRDAGRDPGSARPGTSTGTHETGDKLNVMRD